MSRSRPTLARDLITLTKPGVTRMCAITTAGAAWLAPGFTWTAGVGAVVGASLAVASASAFNMWWERASDPLMPRTRNRPLAAGRLPPWVAVVFASVLGILAVAVLLATTTPIATLLAVLAIAGYVLVYTPLKYRTPHALLIGAFPGAMPPLIGWTAITGSIDPGGLALFAILLVWQMPHFIAITLFRKSEFARAGIRCIPLVWGEGAARRQAVLWALGLVPVSLLPSFTDVTGWMYGVIAVVLGSAFFVRSLRGLGQRGSEDKAWARSLFVASLFYLPALIAAMAVDVMLQ